MFSAGLLSFAQTGVTSLFFSSEPFSFSSTFSPVFLDPRIVGLLEQPPFLMILFILLSGLVSSVFLFMAPPQDFFLIRALRFFLWICFPGPEF